MAAIGEVSSLIALVHFAGQVATEAAELCQNFKDAPRQLSTVSGRTTLLRAMLEDLKSVQDEPSVLETLPAPCRSVVAQALRLTWITVIEIQKACNKHRGVHRPGTRLKWTLLGKKTIDGLLESLHSAEIELILAMNLIQCRTGATILSSISKLRSSVNECLGAPSLPIDDTVFDNNPSFMVANDQSTYSPTYFQNSYTSAGSPFLQKLGIRGCFLLYTCQDGKRYHIILQLPFLQNTTLVLQLGVRTALAAGSGLSVFRQHLSFRNVVSETSPIMIASSQGDLQTVKALLETRVASPFDVTNGGETPLEFAIESRNERLVTFLLENGADPNTIVDEKSGMSALQQALSNHSTSIVRLLLRWGACRWHVDSSGWTNMFYIWARSHADVKNSQHCLKLLLSECHPALTSYDSRNSTALHRAASLGSLEDIQLLLRNGANPLASINNWTPVFYAVRRENHRVVPKLVEAGHDIDYQDGGGWTLLHLAVKTRSKTMLDCLFKLGANPHIKGAPDEQYWKQYHEKSQFIVKGDRCSTPLDLARNSGEDYLEIFLSAAQSAGIDIIYDSGGDVFWPAEENQSESEEIET